MESLFKRETVEKGDFSLLNLALHKQSGESSATLNVLTTNANIDLTQDLFSRLFDVCYFPWWNYGGFLFNSALE